MILTNLLNNGTLIEHYSDGGFLLLQEETGIKYSRPIDVVPCQYTYIETDELEETEENTDNVTEAESNEATIGDYQEALSEFGVKVQ